MKRLYKLLSRLWCRHPKWELVNPRRQLAWKCSKCGKLEVLTIYRDKRGTNE